MFTSELIKYVQSGQTALYVNSREESRVLGSIREAGWLLAGESVDVGDVKFDGPGVSPGRKADGRVSTQGLINALTFLDAEVPVDDEAEKKLADQQRRIHDILNAAGFPVVTWDMVAGFSDDRSAQGEFNAAIARIGDPSGMPNRCLIVMKDCHQHLNNESPLYRRALRNVCEDNRLVSGNLARHIIFLQPYLRPHEDIRHCLVKLDFPLPDDAAIDKEISNTQQGIAEAGKRECPEDLRLEIVGSLRGLDTANIVKTLAYCVTDFNGFVPEIVTPDGGTRKFVTTIRGMRSRQLSTGQGLRIIDPDDPELTSLGDLSGYENVRELADRVIFCRTKKAKQLNLRAPNGFAIAGGPGGGKSQCAKLFATWLGVPMCIANLGTMKEGLVGASEANTAAALDTIRAIGDCVVLFDEFDKQAGGVIGGATDGNTSLGMLSQILDFASDPRRKAFMILTMNRLHGPIESLRAGRISRFFYTPLPDAVDREEIMLLKLAEADAEPPSSLKSIAADAMTGGLSGAELTELVHEAIALAAIRCGEKAPTLNEFTAARSVVTPVMRLNKAEVEAMADFQDIAVSVSKRKTKARPVDQITGKRRIGVKGSNQP